MSKRRFVGVAYWTVTTSVSDWVAMALEKLMPVQQAGLAVVEFERIPAGDQLSVTFGDERHQMLVNAGQGRGVVRASESAALFVICLVALRRALGDITVVTDSQEEVPAVPRQSYPLYAGAWLRVLPVAQELELVVDSAFSVRHRALLNNMF